MIGTNDSNILNGWSSWGNGNVITTSESIYPGSSLPLTDEQKIEKSINDLHAHLKEKVMLFEGLILEMQRKASKEIDFNEAIYKKLETTERSLMGMLKNIQELTEQLEYAKEVLDAIKTSQEISEGYKEYEDKKKNNFRHLNIGGNLTINTLKHGYQTINAVQPILTSPSSNIYTKTNDQFNPTKITFGDAFVDDAKLQSKSDLDQIKTSLEKSFTINGGDVSGI